MDLDKLPRDLAALVRAANANGTIGKVMPDPWQGKDWHQHVDRDGVIPDDPTVSIVRPPVKGRGD